MRTVCQKKNSYQEKMISSFVIAVPQRKINAEKIIREMELPNATIIDAVLAKDLDYKTLENMGVKHPGFDLRLSRYAVQLSHKKALEACLRSGADRCFILEDDVDAGNAGTAWKEVEVSPDADIFFYGRCSDDKNTSFPVQSGIVRTYSPLCRHAYSVTRAAARLLKDMEVIDRSGDTGLAHACSSVFRCYASSPPLVNQSAKCLFCGGKAKFSSLNGNNFLIPLQEYNSALAIFRGLVAVFVITALGLGIGIGFGWWGNTRCPPCSLSLLVGTGVFALVTFWILGMRSRTVSRV